MAERFFSFVVPLDAMPGNVCKINLPSGEAVELVLPEGVQGGTSIEFVASGGDGIEDHDDASTASTTKVVTAQLYWEARPSRRSSQDATGLSNATTEKVFTAVVPKGHRGGAFMHAELTEGGPILVVPVPDGAKPGTSILFEAPAEVDSEALVPVLHKGSLQKKSPKGLPGAHTWQSRWFELQPTALLYWKLDPLEGAVKKGEVRICSIVGVRRHSKEKRLDLLLQSRRLFELKASSPEERNAWVDHLEKALVAAVEGRDAMGTSSSATAVVADASTSREAGEAELEELSLRTEEEAAAEDEAASAGRRSSTPLQAFDGEEDEADEQAANLGAVGHGTPQPASHALMPRAKHVGVASGGNLEATAVIVKARYLSRIERAKQANDSRRRQLTGVADAQVLT